MKMFTEELEQQLKEVFKDMKNEVTIALFTDDTDCYSCKETIAYMEEVSALNEKIHLKQYSSLKDLDLVSKYKIEMVPSLVLLNAEGEYQGVKFNGIPAGHEINSFIPAILEVSGVESDLPEAFVSRVAQIDKPINIKVFITLGCPHCPGAVQKAHKLALMNPNIEAEMIEAQTFGELSNKFAVSGVPKIVINEQAELVGNQPFEAFLAEIESL